MSVTLIVNGTPYEYPIQGQEPPWGEQAQAWASAITTALSALNSDVDILTTSFNPANNQTLVSQNIIGFAFDNTKVQGFIAEYSIYRVVKDSALTITEEYVESGNIYGSYLAGAGTWTISKLGNDVGSTGISIKILNTGQLVYNSTNLTIPVGGSHTCRMVFRATGFANS